MSAEPGEPARPTRLGWGDLAQLHALSRTLAWDHTQDDWASFLKCGLIYGLRRDGGDEPGAPIDACAAVFPYGPHTAVIGMAMVAPDRQRRGLGRAVVARCLQGKPDDTAVYLAATREGLGLYERLGFRHVGGLRKFMHQGGLAEEADAAAEIRDQIAIAHLAPVLRLDRTAFGAPRDAFLKARLSQAATRAAAVDAEGNVVGYGLGVDQGDLRILGPIAAADDAVAAALAARLARDWRGRLRIDLPDHRDGLSKRLEALGFIQVDAPPILARDGAAYPGEAGWRDYAAISCQACL
ncbi:MAG: GNAT family N-acetyltransferase [Marivibrio sp.]|uniref:GNAT family N-acetyltransferase n=1 Tax=Marivibrio sp. TaxID=2039719 RepID=UPI0032F086DA